MGTTSQQPLRPMIINNIAGLCLSLSGKVGITLEQHFVKLLQSHENLRNRLQSSYVSNKWALQYVCFTLLLSIYLINGLGQK